MPISQNAKRSIFGGFFQSGSQKSKEELLEEEKRRQEALIEEQLRALCVDGAFIEEQKRQQENLVKAAAAKVKQKEEGETEKFDSQPRDCVDERKETLGGADSAGGGASRINAREVLDTGPGRPREDLQNSPNSKLSALERRRQQRQKQGSKSGARRPNHHGATGGRGDIGRVDPGKSQGKQRLSQDQELRSTIMEASSRQDLRSKTSDKDQTSHLVSPKRAASRPPMQPPIIENQPLADQKEADASLTFSNADTLSTHLEKANKNTRRRRNRHGDEVSLGSKQLRQQITSCAKTNMLQEHLVDDSPTSKGNRPWESASAKNLLKAKLEERPPPEASTLNDDNFLDEGCSIFEKSVFGLHDDGVSQSDEPRKGRADIEQDRVSDNATERQAIETPIERSTLSEEVNNRQLDEGNSLFDATWKETETDADFVSELKRLNAKTAGNTNNKSRSRQTKSTETNVKEKQERLKLFQSEMKKNATGKKTSVLSREFKEAIDAVFAAEELDEYTVTYSTRMVEGISKDLKRNSMLSEATSSTVSSLPVDDLLEDGSMQTTDAERLVRQLRQRAQANNSSSDAQSLRSRYTINTRSIDTRSRRSSRTTGTSAPSRLNVKGNRLPRRTLRPDRQTISDEKRKTRAGSSGQSVRSYRKSPNLQGARRSSSRSRARSKSGGTQKTNRRRGKTPPSRRRANSADASKLAPKPTSNTPRSSSSIRARSRTPTGETRAAVVRRGKRNDRSRDEASTVVSRVTRSNRSVRTWHIGQGSSIDPAEFYAREMARLKNKRVSAGGLRKEMDDLHQREKRQSAGPPRRPEVKAGSPSREEILPRANQTTRRMYAEPISLVPKSATDFDGFTNADRSALFRMEGTSDATPFVTAANTFDEYSHITQNDRSPSRRFPKLGRGLFRRAKSVDRLDKPVDETEQRLLD